MKILKIIHGYPPKYNAGSEVYSQNICRQLSSKHSVIVFTREEDPFQLDYSVREERDNNIIKHIINIPTLRQRYRYSHSQVDNYIANLLDTYSPDVVHIGHFNHLSSTMIFEIKKRDIPAIYTLHDYWLICARGQFLQRNNDSSGNNWQLCNGQNDKKCATNCYSGYFSGLESQESFELEYWTEWFKARMKTMMNIVKQMDLFIAPSEYLQKKFIDFYPLASDKTIYLDYGFNNRDLTKRNRKKEKQFVFGYIGTHTPQKGIHDLIIAFGKTKANCHLKIWGRKNNEVTKSLENFVQLLPTHKREKIFWQGEYRNDDILDNVFNNVDSIVVPSIWEENSPLVIHEAQQARVPVITANIGGMSEYVHHHINGLLFEHRNINDLADKMDELSQNSELTNKLGNRGYIKSKSGDVVDIADHVRELEDIYAMIINQKRRMHVS